MPINPSIAMSYRAPDIQPQNMLADYAAIQQIQGGQQAQQLNALKMQEYARTRAEEEGLRNYLAGADLAKPETRAGVMKFGKTGLAYGKALGEQETAAATLKKTKAETATSEFNLQKKRLDQSLTDFASFNTVGDVLGHIKKQLDAGQIDQTQAQQLASMVPQSDAELPKFQIAMLRKTLGAKDQLEMSKQTTKDTDRGGYIERQTYDSQGKPVGEPVKLPKTATISEKTAQNQLGLAERKFAFEQANPGYELQQTEDGSLVGVNKRTMQATPVTMGGAAPAAAPGAGVPGPAAAPGAPVKGAPKSKDIAVSEQQASYNIGRVLTAAKQINEIGKKDPSAIQPGAGEAFAASVGMEGTANVARSPNRQIVFGAQRDALDALLYLATGAAYNKEQLAGQMAAYIPAFTDAPETVEAKKTRMTDLIASAKTRAGKAWTPAMDASMKALMGPASAGTPAAPAAANVVVTPDGQSHTFPNAAAAAQFKKAAGL